MRKSMLAVAAAALLAIATVGSVSADPGTGKGPPQVVPSLCKYNSPGPDISSDARANGGIRGGKPGQYVAFEVPCNPLYDFV